MELDTSVEFLMLIPEMTFVFQKSKQDYSRVTLKKLSKKIYSSEVSFCSIELFCGVVVTGQVWIRLNDSGLTIQAERNFPAMLRWLRNQSATRGLRVRIPLRNTILSLIQFYFRLNPPLSLFLYSFAKLICIIFLTIKHTLSTMQSRAEF